MISTQPQISHPTARRVISSSFVWKISSNFGQTTYTTGTQLILQLPIIDFKQ